ncbi:glutaredoxin family protein [Bacillus massiliigorillae]|uniref:glutaredoxin family protein n=1 Tax=Bacillus massiliigorillae TaxID=1243664 RepID=UPI0005A9ECAB|nr:glutaredoxin family protein [Bacillus massiliigorillae]
MRNLSVVVWSKDRCSYCDDVKQYLDQKEIEYKVINLTNRDELRDILEVKYGVRHVPVIEIGEGNTYEAITEVGIQALEKVIDKYN